MRSGAILFCGILLAGCDDRQGPGHSGAEPEAAPLGGGETATVPGTVSIRPEMLRDLRVTTAKSESRTGGEGVSVLGEVKVNEDAYAEVGAPIPARVVRILVSPGDLVNQGQPLVELQGVELGRALSDYLSARARVLLSRKTLERKRSLTGERIALPTFYLFVHQAKERFLLPRVRHQ
jgi:cobalt-zinc-cadmium efflux system membrane fusion protein